MPPSRIATLLRLFQQTPPAGVADNEEVGAKLAQLAAQIKPSNEGRNSLERVAQLPGHALANSIDFAGMAIQPEKIVQGIKGAISNPDQAIAGAKQFGAEVVEEPIKLLEEMGIGEFLAPGAGGIAKLGMAGASLGGGNKFLKKLGRMGQEGGSVSRKLTPTEDKFWLSVFESKADLEDFKEFAPTARLEAGKLSVDAKDVPGLQKYVEDIVFYNEGERLPPSFNSPEKFTKEFEITARDATERSPKGLGFKDPNNLKVLEDGNTPFIDSNFPHIQEVRVEFADGEVIEDAIKGLNKGHALARAEVNWPNAKITPID